MIAPSSTEPSQEQVYEQYYVVSLAILFGIIILMGIALAASGERLRLMSDYSEAECGSFERNNRSSAGHCTRSHHCSRISYWLREKLVRIVDLVTAIAYAQMLLSCLE